MNILVINGPNLNMLGIREPEIYGSETYEMLCARIQAYCDGKKIQVQFYQSNHEGYLVDRIQAAYRDGTDGIVFNPAAYCHTSIALLDALKAVGIPTVEVHITNTNQRESFRQVSYIRQACIAAIIGKGTDGYLEAIDLLMEKHP